MTLEGGKKNSTAAWLRLVVMTIIDSFHSILNRGTIITTVNRWLNRGTIITMVNRWLNRGTIITSIIICYYGMIRSSIYYKLNHLYPMVFSHSNGIMELLKS